jgi:zinc-finger of transposase IS204/IS1001/IS1096/IS1165
MQAQDLVLFQAALGLSDPWRVTSVEFDVEAKRLDLGVDFAKGARFRCPECERAGCAVKDTEEKTWRHLDFFEHQAYLTDMERLIRPGYGGGSGVLISGQDLVGLGGSVELLCAGSWC